MFDVVRSSCVEFTATITRILSKIVKGRNTSSITVVKSSTEWTSVDNASGFKAVKKAVSQI